MQSMRAAVDLPLMLLGGINRLETMEQAMADGFEYVALARAVLREPGLVDRLARERAAGRSGEGTYGRPARGNIAMPAWCGSSADGSRPAARAASDASAEVNARPGIRWMYLSSSAAVGARDSSYDQR